MIKFQPRRRFRDLLYTKLAVVILFIAVLGLSRSVYLTWRRERLADAERRAVLDQLASLGTRQSQLTADLASLQTERGVEERIRQQFSVAREGERVVNVILPPATTSTSTGSGLPWWQVLGNLFK